MGPKWVNSGSPAGWIRGSGPPKWSDLGSSETPRDLLKRDEICVELWRSVYTCIFRLCPFGGYGISSILQVLVR